MSKEDLVRLYSERAISRRVFIRGLVAAGVSVSAASAYARLLGTRNAFAAERPTGGPGSDFYDFYADFYQEFYPDFYGDFYDLDEFYDFYLDFYDEDPCDDRGHRRGRHGRRDHDGRRRHRHPRRGRRS